MKMDDYVKTDKLIALEGQEGVLSPVGITKMYEFLGKERLTDKYLLNTFDWRAITEEGKLVKRVATMMYQKCGVRFSKEKLTELGNLCAKYCSGKEKMWMQIDNNFDWIQGDFADSSSCLFGSPTAFGAYQAIGAYAMKVFLERGEGKAKKEPRHWKTFYKHLPFGRCLLWPHPTEKNAIIVFNGYGGSRDTVYFANILSAHLGWTHSAGISVGKGNRDEIYVNSGTTVISDHKMPSSALSVYFGNVPSGTKIKDLRIFICKSCQERLINKDRHANDRWHEYHAKCVHYCSKCGYMQDNAVFEKCGKLCVYCNDDETKCGKCNKLRRGKVLVMGLLREEEDAPKEIPVCVSCFENYVRQCEECGDQYVDNGERYCPHCEYEMR